ncbi:MAG: hypothetical protein RBU37_17695 [Myxococcota bacterium]|jgi:hypothetical protein|nr:hypothetical protein [Myxococcota bacterium]
MNRNVLLLLTSLLLFAGCGEDEPTVTDWVCDASHDGWEKCTDNKVQHCHIVEGMDHHFHWGADCAALGLTCMVRGEAGHAACVDTATPCTETDQRCENNTAYFCIDGKLAQDPCGTSKHCHADEGVPHCEELDDEECSGHGHLHDGECHCEEGYVLAPDDATKCVSEVDFPTQSCTLFAGTAHSEAAVTPFSEFPNAHVELDQVYEVTLPDNVESYVHFPVTESAEYVIFLSTAGIFGAFLHRNESSINASGGVPNGMCSDTIADHYHAELSFDGAETDTKVPYIVRFNAVSGGATVKVLIRKKE